MTKGSRIYMPKVGNPRKTLSELYRKRDPIKEKVLLEGRNKGDLYPVHAKEVSNIVGLTTQRVPFDVWYRWLGHASLHSVPKCKGTADTCFLLMGAVISKAANFFGVTLGNAFVAPFKTIFGKSCEGVCLGTWDLICFVEHLCIANLLKLLLVSVLVYIVLLFFYLLFKIGIIQCLLRSLCKMAWAACETYWSALEDISCFLWHKIKNTKRVHRGRFRDIEQGGNITTSESEPSMVDYSAVRASRRRRSVRVRRRDRMHTAGRIARHTRSLNLSRHRLKHRAHSHSHVRWKTSEVSVRVKNSGRVRDSRELQIRNVRRRIR